MVDSYSGPRMKLRLWSQTPTTNERRGAWTGGQEERMMTEDLEPGPMWGHSSAPSSGSLQWRSRRWTSTRSQRGGVVARHLCTTASRSGGGGGIEENRRAAPMFWGLSPVKTTLYSLMAGRLGGWRRWAGGSCAGGHTRMLGILLNYDGPNPTAIV
jgi:hypothetical protein